MPPDFLLIVTHLVKILQGAYYVHNKWRRKGGRKKESKQARQAVIH